MHAADRPAPWIGGLSRSARCDRIRLAWSLIAHARARQAPARKPHEDATVSEQPRSGSASDPSAPPDTHTRLRGLIRRPGVWVLGIVGTVATGYVTASLNDLTKSVGGYVSELSCQWRTPSLAPDEAKGRMRLSSRIAVRHAQV